MKVMLEAVGNGFVATTDQDSTDYFGDSETEALGEAIRGNVHRIPGLEIQMKPKSEKQLAHEARRRDATRVHGN